MTVKELTEHLKGLPAELQDVEVRVQGCDQCWLMLTENYEVFDSAEDESKIVLLLT